MANPPMPTNRSGGDYPEPRNVGYKGQTFTVVPTYPSAPGSKPFTPPKTPPLNTDPGNGVIIPAPKG